MSFLPRIALGTLGEAVDARPMLAALLSGMQAQGWQSQVFRSQARHDGDLLPRAVTGRCPAHLDSWLMPRWQLRQEFAEAARGAELSLVTGDFAGGDSKTLLAQAGGSLATACQWLDLPRVAIVSARAISLGHFPARPATLAGLLVDGVTSPTQAAELRTRLERHYHVPVLGWLEELPALRARLEQTRTSQAALAEMAHRLNQSLVLPRGWRSLKGMLRAHAQAHPLPAAATSCAVLPRGGETRVQVAVAYDEAFQHYFPNALDALEAGGAVVRTFSPLADEGLPEGADLVLLCGGRLEGFAGRLAANQCLLQSLRRYVAEGGRVYAEGGGMAYLSEHITLPTGECWPLVGALPLAARLAAPAAAVPCDLATLATCWLARRGTQLVGYRQADWQFTARGPVYEIAVGRREPAVVLGRHNVIGSCLQLHFAAMPGLLENLLALPAPRLQAADI